MGKDFLERTTIRFANPLGEEELCDALESLSSHNNFQVKCKIPKTYTWDPQNKDSETQLEAASGTVYSRLQGFGILSFDIQRKYL